MSLEELAYISQVVAVVLIFPSVIYLALQVRQTEKNQRAMMTQARADRITNVSVAFSQPDVAAVMAKASLAAPEFSPQEVSQLHYVLRTQIVALNDAMRQADMGFLDKVSLENAVQTTKRMLSVPAYRATWSLLRQDLSPHLVERLERTALTGNALTTPGEAYASWKETYGELLVVASRRS